MLYTHSRNEALGPLPIIQCVGGNGAHLWGKEESLLRPVLSMLISLPLQSCRHPYASRYPCTYLPLGYQFPLGS